MRAPTGAAPSAASFGSHDVPLPDGAQRGEQDDPVADDAGELVPTASAEVSGLEPRIRQWRSMERVLAWTGTSSGHGGRVVPVIPLVSGDAECVSAVWGRMPRLTQQHHHEGTCHGTV